MSINPITVYVAYARKDEALRNALSNHLSTLKRNNVIASWDDSDIDAGEEIDPLVTRKFATAQVILLLVSADFLASDALWELGGTQALQRHRAGVAKVIPIILRPCDCRMLRLQR
ncbi:MAG: TIR domain-containing protein [Cyanobacteria bacterium P01_E01_bin.6]